MDLWDDQEQSHRYFVPLTLFESFCFGVKEEDRLARRTGSTTSVWDSTMSTRPVLYMKDPVS